MNFPSSEQLSHFLPENTYNYCFELWQMQPFHFRITKPRESKLGDYRFEKEKNLHYITVNRDLNKYSFLITYLHEVAHLQTTVMHGWRVKPHGEEWKNVFKRLLFPVLETSVLPEDIKQALKGYTQNPKASSCTDLNLQKTLANYDLNRMHFLSEVKISESFKFNKRIFVKESVIRTRALCKEMPSGRKFYISEGAQVEILQASLF